MSVDFLPFSALPEGERQGIPEWPADVREAVGEKPPEGWLRMSAEDYAAYRALHEAAQNEWVRQQSLPRLKDELLAQLAEYRWLREMAGHRVNGVRYDTDREARGSLTAAVLLAQMAMQSGQHYEVMWKGPDGFSRLDGPTLVQIGIEVAAYVAGCFKREAELQEEIAALKSVDEAEKFDILERWRETP